MFVFNIFKTIPMMFVTMFIALFMNKNTDFFSSSIEWHILDFSQIVKND